jgi:P27 family predicted phage terminase small subunit
MTRRRSTKVPPPECLSNESKKLWKKVVTHQFSDGRLILLEQALLTLDRANEAKEIVNSEGLITTTKRSGVVHVHPAVKVERENRQLFIKAWKEMGLSWNSLVDGS